MFWEHGIAFSVNCYNDKLREKSLDRLLIFPDKLIIYVDDTRAIWPLNFSSANVNFSNLKTAVSFLNEIKSLKKEDWIKRYNEIINKDRMGK